VAGPPAPDLIARRAERRAQIRRRRLMALGGVLAMCAVVVVVIVATSGSSTAHRGPSASASSSAGGAGSNAPGTKARHRSGANGHLQRLDAAGAIEIRRLAKLGLPVYCAGPRGNAVAFTFDDGPGPYTYLALRKLTQAGERATFFVVGRSIDAFPHWIPRELKLAAIGDHSYTHPVLSSLPVASITSELERTKQRIKADAGIEPLLFRPPYGARNAAVDQVAKQLGLLEIVWNIDSADSLGANYAGITRNVLAGLRPGSIILMHENRGQTIRALTTLLPELHRRHIRSVTLPELMAEDPPSKAQLERGPAGCAAPRAVGAGSGG
jgi:peptidoglycan/xylan/chitin deacetylase (PgdA/CDA1 family)